MSLQPHFLDRWEEGVNIPGKVAEDWLLELRRAEHHVTAGSPGSSTGPTVDKGLVGRWRRGGVHHKGRWLKTGC